MISAFTVAEFSPGQCIFGEGLPAKNLHIIFNGTVTLTKNEQPVAELSTGQCLGETSLLSEECRPHSLTATAKTAVETAVLPHQDMLQMIRRNPDIGVIIYRNIAADVSAKLSRCPSWASPSDQIKRDLSCHEFEHYFIPNASSWHTECTLCVP